jgi:hypothetical protein
VVQFAQNLWQWQEIDSRELTYPEETMICFGYKSSVNKQKLVHGLGFPKPSTLNPTDQCFFFGKFLQPGDKKKGWQIQQRDF